MSGDAFVFNRPLSWREWIQWAVENRPELFGFAPHGRALRQPRPARHIPTDHEDRENQPETLREGARS